MKFNEYQELSKQTAFGYATSDSEESNKQLTILYLALAINGEAGEIAEKAKKWLREGDDQYLEELKDELGDVQWYMARLADELDKPLNDVAEENLDKLLDRQERGALTGSGDDR